MSSYKNENENNVQINPKILSRVYNISVQKFVFEQNDLNRVSDIFEVF